jgi:hypothetical protein
MPNTLEGGALEHQRCVSVVASEPGMCAVEHVQRLAHAALDLEHPSKRKRDRDLSGRIDGRL